MRKEIKVLWKTAAEIFSRGKTCFVYVIEEKQDNTDRQNVLIQQQYNKLTFKWYRKR